MADQGRKGSGIPSIKPERDEVASFRRSARSEAPRPSNWSGVLGVVILLMGAMMVAGGIALYEVQQKLDHANRLLAQGQADHSDLESRLAATGTDVSKTLGGLDARVKTNFSEIDKLWAVAFRQNKPEIQQNAQAIEKLQLDLEGQLALINGAVKTINEQSDGLVDDSEELLIQLALLRSQVQEQATLMEAIRRQANSLDARMQDVQKDIDAINGFRASFNERLLQLEQR